MEERLSRHYSFCFFQHSFAVHLCCVCRPRSPSFPATSFLRSLSKMAPLRQRTDSSETWNASDAAMSAAPPVSAMFSRVCSPLASFIQLNFRSGFYTLELAAVAPRRCAYYQGNPVKLLRCLRSMGNCTWLCQQDDVCQRSFGCHLRGVGSWSTG